MIFSTNSLIIASLLAATLPSMAAVSILAASDFTTVEGFVSGEGGSQTLNSITIGGNATTDLQFATGDAGGSHILHGVGTTLPADTAAAFNDARFDTGSLNTGSGDTFALSGLTDADYVFLFFNAGAGAFFQYPTQVQAFDSGDTQIGSTVSLSDSTGASFGSLDIRRYRLSTSAYQGDLGNRGFYAYLIPVADFGATAGDIAGIQFAGSAGGSTNIASHDFNLVGAATPIPEPSAWLLGVLGSLGMLLRRHR